MKTSKRRQAQRSNARSKRHIGPRTLEEFLAMPEKLQDQWIRNVNAISEMRAHGVLPPQAAREFGLSPHTLRRLGAPALRKDKKGQYVAKASDRLLRPMLVLTPEGPREIGIRDSRAATLVAEHWNAAHRYLETGDTSVRRKFRGKSIIDANGNKIRLMTNLEELSRQGNAGNLSFESIYPK